jgi:hypothetical protein
MSRIKTLRANNLKGYSFDEDLAPVNIVVGDNTSGKTAVLAAVKLVLLGYEPRWGKTSGATFGACGSKGGGATSLTVQALLDNDTLLSRVWEIKRGKVSYTGPEHEYIPGMLLDPTTYFALSGPARLNYVLSQVDLSKVGISCEAVCANLVKDIKPETGPAVEALHEVQALIAELEAERQNEDASIYDWLTAVVDKITTTGKEAATAANTHEQTVKGLTSNKADDGDMSAIESVQPEINDAREEHTKAVQAEANAENAYTAARNALNDAKQLAAKAVDESKVHAEIEAQKAVIERAKLVPVAGEPPIQRLMTTPRPTDAPEHAAFNAAQAKAQATARELFNTAAEQQRLLKSIQDAKAHTSCPTCGHDITEKQAKVVAELEKQYTKALKAAEKAGIEHKAAADAEKAAGDATIHVTADIAAWDTASQQLLKENQEKVAKWNKSTAEFNAAQSTINTATATIQKLEASLAANATAAEAWAKLPALEKAAQEAGETATAATRAIQPILDRIRMMEGKQRQFIARTQDARRADQSRAAYAAAKAKADIYNASLKVVAGEKDRVATEAFELLLRHARKFTDGILKAPLEYRDGELGMTYQGNWVGYKYFSGAEELIAFAGLAVALTQNEKPVVRIVMMDELGKLDKNNKVKLADRMVQLHQQGVIDQFIGCDVQRDDYLHLGHKLADFQVIPVASCKELA